jgi:hypothetical protein
MKSRSAESHGIFVVLTEAWNQGHTVTAIACAYTQMFALTPHSGKQRAGMRWRRHSNREYRSQRSECCAFTAVWETIASKRLFECRG